MRRSRTTAFVGIVAALWIAGSSAAALGSTQPPQQAAQGQAVSPAASPAAQEEFVPVKSLPAHEQLPAVPLVLSAYAFIWVALLVYLWTIWRRLMKVEQEMRTLTARLGEKAGRP
jgi:CcmD family protein